MAFCTECGTEVPTALNFCTGCGTPMRAAAQPAPVTAAQVSGAPVATAAPPQPPAAQSTYAPPPARPAQAAAGHGELPPAPGSKYAVMGMGAYIGTMLLFSIPVVGWVCCIIAAFTAKNQNRRNLARATLVFLIAGMVLAAALYVVAGWVWESIVLYAGETSGGASGSYSELGGLFDAINSAGLSGQ